MTIRPLTQIVIGAIWGLLSWNYASSATAQQQPVDLGAAANFAVLAGEGITNVPATQITGDLGVSPSAVSTITGFSMVIEPTFATSAQVDGFIYGADMTEPTPTNLSAAKGDLTTAYNDAAGRTPVPAGPFLNPGSGNLAGLTLGPGLYKFTESAIATADFTLMGNARDVWIFQIATSLNVSDGVQAVLAGGAHASNIFWQVGTSANIDTTAVFKGTIMAEASITLKNGASLEGRALAFSGMVTLDTNEVVIPVVEAAAQNWQLYD